MRPTPAALVAVAVVDNSLLRRVSSADKKQLPVESAGSRGPAVRLRGFSLLEIIAALAIVSILVMLIVPNYSRIIAAAQEAMCASNMRHIRVALGQYLQDHENIWPQAPVDGGEQEIQQFWFATLKPYDVSERTWQCPTIRSKLGQEGGKDVSMHYAPTAFDATPDIANRWATQPWLIEVADAHGKGPLICFPDGSVKSFSKVLAEQGVR